MGGGLDPFGVMARRSQSSEKLEKRTAEPTSHAVAARVFAQQFTQDALPPFPGHAPHVAVKRSPASLHLVIGDDRLIGLAFEVESLKDWHSLAFARGRRSSEPRLLRIYRPWGRPAGARGAECSAPPKTLCGDSWLETDGMLVSVLN